MMILMSLVTMRCLYNERRNHDSVDSILKELQKAHVLDEGRNDGEIWNGKNYRKEISVQDKILVVAIANVAVDAVMLNVVKHWPKAKILKIGATCHDPRLQGYCLEAICQQIQGWDTFDEEQKKEHKSKIIKNADIIFSTCASCQKTEIKECMFSHVFVDEAALATEEERLCSVMKGCTYLLLIGDHKQLRAQSHISARGYDSNAS